MLEAETPDDHPSRSTTPATRWPYAPLSATPPATANGASLPRPTGATAPGACSECGAPTAPGSLHVLERAAARVRKRRRGARAVPGGTQAVASRQAPLYARKPRRRASVPPPASFRCHRANAARRRSRRLAATSRRGRGARPARPTRRRHPRRRAPRGRLWVTLCIAANGNVPAAVRATLPAVCEKCGQIINPGDLWELDHRVPRSRGGTNDLSTSARCIVGAIGRARRGWRGRRHYGGARRRAGRARPGGASHGAAVRPWYHGLHAATPRGGRAVPHLLT